MSALVTRCCPFDTDGDGDCGRPNCPYCAPTMEGEGRVMEHDRVEPDGDGPDNDLNGEDLALDADLSLDANPAQRDSRAIERLRPTDES